MDMSELSKLLGQHRKKVTFLGKEFEIEPLGVEVLPDLLKIDDDKITSEERAKAIINIVKQVLKNIFPDITDEEVRKIPVVELNKLLQQITNDE